MYRLLQGYLAHKKLPPTRILQQAYDQGPTVVLGGGAVSYERGAPVLLNLTEVPFALRRSPLSTFVSVGCALQGLLLLLLYDSQA